MKVGAVHHHWKGYVDHSILLFDLKAWPSDKVAFFLGYWTNLERQWSLCLTYMKQMDCWPFDKHVLRQHAALEFCNYFTNKTQTHTQTWDLAWPVSFCHINLSLLLVATHTHTQFQCVCVILEFTFGKYSPEQLLSLWYWFYLSTTVPSAWRSHSSTNE